MKIHISCAILLALLNVAEAYDVLMVAGGKKMSVICTSYKLLYKSFSFS